MERIRPVPMSRSTWFLLTRNFDSLSADVLRVKLSIELFSTVSAAETVTVSAHSKHCSQKAQRKFHLASKVPISYKIGKKMRALWVMSERPVMRGSQNTSTKSHKGEKGKGEAIVTIIEQRRLHNPAWGISKTRKNREIGAQWRQKYLPQKYANITNSGQR